MTNHNEQKEEHWPDGDEIPTVLTPIIVSGEEYRWLCEQLDAPPRDLPRLREALAEKPIWQQTEVK
jgi:hypothetical protein